MAGHHVDMMQQPYSRHNEKARKTIETPDINDPQQLLIKQLLVSVLLLAVGCKLN